jgi:putative MATE family efflux protein
MKHLISSREFYGTMFRLALPIAVQNLVASSLNMVDTIMIGQLGQSELAAVGISNQVFFLMVLFLFGTYSGASIFTAQFWGREDVANIRRVLGIALFTGTTAALLFTLGAMLFPTRILGLYMKNSHVIELGRSYLTVVALSYVLTAVTFAYGFISRSVGQAKLPMAVSAVSLLTNTALNYLLIFGHFGFPALGVKGAAIATVLSRGLEMCLLLFFVYRLDYVLAATWREMSDITVAYVKNFFKTAHTVILNEFFWAFGVMVCTIAYARMGERPYAALQMATPIQNISFVLFIGLANACAIMLGNQIGACEDEKAFYCAKKFVLIGPVLALLFGLVIIFNARWFVSGYNVDISVKTAASQILVVYALTLAARVFNLINIIGVLRSGGDTRYTLLLDSGGIWLIAVPMAFLGGMVWKLPIHLVMALVSAEELFKMVFGLQRLYSKKWVRNIVSEMDIGL